MAPFGWNFPSRLIQKYDRITLKALKANEDFYVS
jgi:hypothetical protein